MTRLRPARAWIGPLLLVAIALLLVACAPVPGASPGVPGGPSATPQTPLRPAQPGADPVSLLAWAFTPVFQTMFVVLVGVYAFLENLGVPGAIGIAIVALTLLVRTILIPLMRKQLVSQRRMQMLQPEFAEIKRRFKGDAMKQRVAQQELMKERGVNPLAGCFPMLLQMPLLFIIYSVIQHGLTSYDPTPMLTVGGVQLVPLTCPAVPPPPGVIEPCINTRVPWLLGLDISRPETFIPLPVTLPLIGHGLSVLALTSALLQLVASRMTLLPQDPTNDDPNARVQRQMMLFLPLISIVYGGLLPAGLFIYWIVATLFSIVQQYLIVGWGSMFPIFGWTPSFARDHTPRFPVTMPPPPDPSTRSSTSVLTATDSRAVSASKTIRQRERGRQGRRGRRR